MVRREGSRFGVSTSHNVKRQHLPYKHVHVQQEIVVDTNVDTEGHQIRKWARSALRKQLQKGPFNIPDGTNHVLRFSLNKAKRWEVIEEIKEEEYCHGGHTVLTEHHILPMSSHSCDNVVRSCVGVFDSTDKVKRSPKKTYAKARDLMMNHTLEEKAEKEEDEEFGKKNRKRSRRRRTQEQEVAHTTVEYGVLLAPPKQTYQTYCNPVGSSGNGKRNRNSRNRTKKLHQCNMSDVFSDGLWQLEEEYTYDMEEDGEEEYWQEESKDAEPYQKCRITLETLVNGAMRCGSIYDQDYRSSASSEQTWGTKDRVFPIDKEDAITALHPAYIIPIRQKRKAKKQAMMKEEAKEHIHNPVIVAEKPNVVTSVLAGDITDEKLQGEFGECYVEGQCMPRRFAINVTNTIVEQLKSSHANPDLVAVLEQTSHHVFTVIDCMLDPWQVMREDHRLMEEITVKVCGVSEGQELLTNTLSCLENAGISDVVHALSQSLALLPVQSYLIETSVSTVPTKPVLAVGTVCSALGWQYDITNVNKATEKNLDRVLPGHSETGAVVPSGASNDCDSCGICYEELDERCHGTALVSCSHWFCDVCWRNHLITRIDHGDINITCPEFKCIAAVDKVTVMSLVPSKYYSRYHINKTNAALMLQPELLWCPSPYCGRLLRLANQKTDAALQSRVVPVNCECGMFWCSECKREAHWPASCQQAKLYREKAKKLFKMKNDQILQVNTKRCPRCCYPIEKFYGCNHMMCKCGYEFCWACGKDFNCSHYRCTGEGKWKYTVYDLRPADIVEKTAVDLAVLHHRKRTQFACHRRRRKARKLASKLFNSQDFTASSDSDSDNSGSFSSRTSPISMVTGHAGPPTQLREMRRILSDTANFLSEGEFVLEHLEILLASTPPSSNRTVLSEHKTRLLFITGNLHKFFNEEAELDIAKVQHLLHCGKSCLRWIALAATHLSSSMASASTEE